MTRATGRVLKGRAVVPGVACGTVHRIASYSFSHLSQRAGEASSSTAIHSEERKFFAALDLAREDFRALGGRVCATQEAAHSWTQKLISELLETQRLILDDPLLLEHVTAGLKRGQRASRAVWGALGALEAKFVSSGSELLRARVPDLRSAVYGLLRRLEGAPAAECLPGKRVVVARVLAPAELLWLGRERIVGLALEAGSPEDHTCVLAQTLGIPTLLQVEGLTDVVHQGDEVMVDAVAAELVLRPAKAEATSARRREIDILLPKKATHGEELSTKDGKRFSVTASIELPEESRLAEVYGARAIGLFRTEYLCLVSGRVLDEVRQLEAYEEVLRLYHSGPVTFRMFDFGAGKELGPPGFDAARTCGREGDVTGRLRGLAWGLEEKRVLSTQFRALLRASTERRIGVLLPFVQSVEDFHLGRQSFTEAAAVAEQELGVPCRAKLGAMIETCDIARRPDALIEASDFVAVGSSDLIASFHLDEPTSRFSFLDARVLRVLQEIRRTCREHDVPVSLCGSMAVEPLALPLLLGLGYDNFAVPCSMIPAVRRTLSKLSSTECEALVKDFLFETIVAEAGQTLSARFAPVLEGLWPKASYQ